MPRAFRLAPVLLMALCAALPTAVASPLPAVPGVPLPLMAPVVEEQPGAPIAAPPRAPALVAAVAPLPTMLADVLPEGPDLTTLTLYPTLAKLAPGEPLPEPEARAIEAAVEAASPPDLAPAPEASEAATLPYLREAPFPAEPLRGATAPAQLASLTTAGRTATLVPTALASSPPTAEAAAGAAAVLTALGLGLYTRLSPSAVLRSPARRALVAAIRRDPGCTAHALARALGLDDKTVRHHLRVLQRAGCVTPTLGNPARLFVNGDLPPAGMRAAVALRAASARALLDALERGPARGVELARVAAVHEATASVQLRRLAQAGLAQRGADGRWALAG